MVRPFSYAGDFSQEAEQQKKDQWPCESCTFLNHIVLTVCEMCDQHRIEPVPVRAMVGEPQVSIDSMREESAFPTSGRAPIAGKKWPSLQQAVEKSWDFCEQSSVASSAIDTARLADVEDAHEDVARNVKVTDQTHACPAECYDIFSDTGSRRADDDISDVTSMASWLHLATSSEAFKANCQAENTSVASSWVDVGNLADFEADNEKAGLVETSSIAASREIVEQLGSCDGNSLGSPQPCGVKRLGARGATSWSSLVAATGGTGGVKIPMRPGVPMPPLTRCQAPRKKAVALDSEDVECEDDQDGRGRARAGRKYRQRR
jgi:hypothetical protein